MQKNLGIDPHAVGPMSYKDWKASGWGSKTGAGNFGLLSSGDLGNLVNLPNPGTVINPKTGMPFTDFEWDQHKRASGQGASGWDRGPSAEGIASIPLWQQQGFNSYADWLAAQGGGGGDGGGSDIPIESPASPFPYTVDPNTDDLTQGRGGWFYNDGGRAGYAGGGDVRQRYLFGGLGKLFKKITKPIKKITKSKAGRAAMLALAGYYLGGGQGLGGSRMFGTKFGENFALKNLMNRKGAGFLMGGGGEEGDKYKGKWNPWKVGIAGLSLAPFLMGDDEEEDEGKMYEDWLKEKAKWDARYADIPTTSLPSPYSRNLMGAADG